MIELTNSKTQLAEIYTTADIFINPTYEDDYPTTNLEAQAYGTRCVTHNTRGSIEIVPKDCIVEQEDLKSLKRIIISNYKNKLRLKNV